jgi:hypothetical protein
MNIGGVSRGVSSDDFDDFSRKDSLMSLARFFFFALRSA